MGIVHGTTNYYRQLHMFESRVASTMVPRSAGFILHRLQISAESSPLLIQRTSTLVVQIAEMVAGSSPLAAGVELGEHVAVGELGHAQAGLVRVVHHQQARRRWHPPRHDHVGGELRSDGAAVLESVPVDVRPLQLQGSTRGSTALKCISITF